MAITVFSFGIMLTGTRGSILSVLALLLFFNIAGFKRKPLSYLIILIATIIIALFFLIILPDGLSQRIFGRVGNDVSTGRFDLWLLGVSFISENPILGNGLGYFESRNFNGIGIHNAFLAILVEFGLFGLFLYAPVVFSIGYI